jgi:hypothetical protein
MVLNGIEQISDGGDGREILSNNVISLLGKN